MKLINIWLEILFELHGRVIDNVLRKCFQLNSECILRNFTLGHSKFL